MFTSICQLLLELIIRIWKSFPFFLPIIIREPFLIQFKLIYISLFINKYNYKAALQKTVPQSS